jgi:hypothetical protein
MCKKRVASLAPEICCPRASIGGIQILRHAMSRIWFLGSFVTVKMAVSNFRRHEDTRRIRCLTLSFMMEWE